MPKSLDFLLHFGNIDFFRAMLAEGFTSVAYGCSRHYQGGYRIAAIFAFYKPVDAPRSTEFVQVPTWQVAKEKVPLAGEIDYAVPCEMRYSEAALAEYLRKRHVLLGAPMDIAGVLCAMETQALSEKLAGVS